MEELRHSRVGIASFVLGLLSAVWVSVVLIFGPRNQIPNWIHDGLFIEASPFTSLAALGLGVADLFQKRRRRLLAILGTVFALAVLTFWVVFVFYFVTNIHD